MERREWRQHATGGKTPRAHACERARTLGFRSRIARRAVLVSANISAAMTAASPAGSDLELRKTVPCASTIKYFSTLANRRSRASVSSTERSMQARGWCLTAASGSRETGRACKVSVRVICGSSLI